ncbi:leucine-rich repeat domain-containing protein [Chondrinema litorale]|uniref:leucine-rich repeat domain-containing protein n=1 Tax=Chondrinema litorale TaxID=2994555 RepID=UPI0025438FBD|nr:immunoglobulin domain-containing protein [Chondrinema litorale]UZR92287.1 immunoglobulin domain-containing protein [Chondrinema litorale]
MNRKKNYSLFQFLGLLIFFTQVFSLNDVHGQSCDPENDKQVLLDLLVAGWKVDNSWSASNIDNYASWTGVKTWREHESNSNYGSCIYELMLSKAESKGSIPESIGKFSFLRILWLNDNNLTGNFPSQILNLTDLTNLYIQGNSFSPSSFNGFEKLTNLQVFGFDNNTYPFSDGYFPSLSKLTDLATFFIRDHAFENVPITASNNLLSLGFSGNYFTFEDLLPFASNSNLSSFFFYPQRKFNVPNTSVTANEGEDVTINLGIDANVNSNTYAWYKDGKLLTTTSINSLTIKNVTISEHSGTYYCIVSNDDFDKYTVGFIRNGNNDSELRIQSEDITLDINARQENECVTRGRIALKAFYNALNGGSWSSNDNWNDDTKALSEWYGVTTDDNGCVIKIELSENNLSGQIPSEIGSLTELESLVLEVNNISSPLPSSLSKLINLKILKLSNNKLGGTLDDHKVVFNISSLEELLLYTNGISGSIPSEIGNLTNLEFLSLGDNNLSGNLPDAFYNLRLVSRLHVNKNQLTGGISSNIKNLNKLNHLRIEHNNFDAQLPVELGNISSLKHLWFEENEFTFDDLIPILSYNNLQNLETLQYSQQGNFTTSTPYTGTEGESLTVKSGFGDSEASNLYSWYKEGENTPVFESNSKDWTLDPLTLADAGKYRVEVTNPTFEKAVSRFKQEPLVIPSNNFEIVVNERRDNPPTDILLSDNVITSLFPGEVGELSTVDADNPDDSHTYELTDNCEGNNNNIYFSIEGNKLYLKATPLTLNFLSQNVCITTTDNTGNTYSKLFEISFNILNNAPTDIELSNNEVDSENATSGYTIGELSTVDADNPNDQHTYSLTDNCSLNNSDNNLFTISGNQLQFSNAYEYDPEKTSFQICVTTTDSQEATYSKAFTIRINITNNPPTNILLSENVVSSEDASSGYTIGELSTVDADNPDDEHTYTLTDNCSLNSSDNSVFAISGNQLQFANSYVYDAEKTSFEVCVTSTDKAGERYSKTFTIIITINNNLPTDILLSNSVVSSEDASSGYTIGELSTVDEDNPDDEHTYTLTANCSLDNSNNNLFTISGNQLQFSNSYSYSPDQLIFEICLTSTDKAGDSYSKTFEITVRPTVDDCVANDKAILQAIYNSLGGNAWPNSTGWNSEASLDQWYGVTTNDNGCVIKLILNNNNLSGTIPTEIGNFSNIVEIDFGKNSISGSVPAAFGNLTTLEILWLNENDLTGQIPGGFFGMSNLTNLYLFSNNFTPPMPNQLNQLTKLKVFGFDNNTTKFGDDDFPSINNLTVLEKFYIQNHAFEDVPEIINPDLLTELGIANNKLTFEDVLPFTSLGLSIYSYAPQDSVGEQATYNLQKGDAFTFDLGIDESVTTSTYKWYKDGELVAETNENQYTIDAVTVDDAGNYTCIVTNTNAADLTLYSRTVAVYVNDTDLPAPVLTAELDENNPVERIILNWTYSNEYTPDNYIIEKSVGDSTNFSVLNDSWNQKTYTDGNGLEPGQTYYYRILAVVDGEKSPYSNIAYVTTNSLPTIVDIDKTGSSNLDLQFALADFTAAYSDVDNDPLVTIQILSLPSDGQLKLGSTNVAVDDEIDASEINNLIFVPDTDWTGTTSFSYNASDGYNYAANPADVNITIQEVDDIDLIVENPTVDENIVEAGGSLNLTVNVAVKGSNTSNATEFVFLLSTDTLPGGDILLGTENIEATEPDSDIPLNISVTLPEDLEEGTYFIIYYVDAQQKVAETNELNNLKYIQITITNGEIIEGPPITIMNVITPNADGFNDHLYIENIEYYPDNEVIFLDRWGNEIHRAIGYNNDWEPVINEDVADFGSYVCIVTINETTTGDFIGTFKRMVSIVRDSNQ